VWFTTEWNDNIDAEHICSMLYTKTHICCYLFRHINWSIISEIVFNDVTGSMIEIKTNVETIFLNPHIDL